MSKTRGVLYIVWPGKSTDKVLDRSIASVKEIHPELPIHVESIKEPCELMVKSRMMEFSPFDETLFLDADTVVLDRLDFGFEKAAKHGLAACVCECPLARRYGGLKDRGDMVEYNTGVLFFTREAKPIFDKWNSLAWKVDSSIVFRMLSGVVDKMPSNDQASFAMAIDELDALPFTLPLNWNFRPSWHTTWFAAIKVWHDYSAIPASVLEWNKRQSTPKAIIECSSLK